MTTNITKYALPTNWTNSTGGNITGFYSFNQYLQDVSSGWLWILLTYAIAVIIFISLKDYETPKAFAFATFFNMIITIMLAAVGFVSSTFMYLSIILVAVAAVWLVIDNSGRF